MEESLPVEHCFTLLRGALEGLLDGHAVPNESDCHFEATWWDVTDRCLDIVGDPFHEVAAILILHIEHLLIHLLHGHPITEDSCNCEVPAMACVTDGHRILVIEDLLGKFRDSERPVLLASMAIERGESRYEEVEAWAWHHVDSHLLKVSVKLAWEMEVAETGWF
jgi:hypothetical protein